MYRQAIAVASLVACSAAFAGNSRTTPPMPRIFSGYQFQTQEADPHTTGNLVPAPMPVGQTTSMGCSFVNVSTESRQIEVRMYRDASLIGYSVAWYSPGEVQPWATIKGTTLPPLTYQTCYCKFTVLNGDREDIRGSIFLRLNDQVIAVLPAD